MGVGGLGEKRGICPMVMAVKAIGSPWSMVVLYHLLDRPKGFNELLHSIQKINPKTLSRTLKSLQARGLVKRTVKSVQPFSVEYSLTPMALDLKDILNALIVWSEKWVLVKQELPDGASGYDQERAVENSQCG